MKPLLKCSSVLAVGLCLLTWGWFGSKRLSAQAPFDPQAWYRTRGLLLVEKIRHDIARSSPKVAELDRNIRYRVVPDATFLAYARVGNRRSITVSSGAVQAIDTVSTVLASVAAFGNHCPMRYLARFGEVHRDNMQSVSRGFPAKGLIDPLSWMSAHCRGPDRATFMAHPTANTMRELMLVGGLKLLVAHELGHHWFKDHLLDDNSPDSQTKEHEREADRFALKIVAATGGSPFDAMALIVLFVYIDFYAGWPVGTHPTGLERMATLADAAFDVARADAEYQRYLRENGNLDQWVKFEQLVRQVLPWIGDADAQRDLTESEIQGYLDMLGVGSLDGLDFRLGLQGER